MWSGDGIMIYHLYSPLQGQAMETGDGINTMILVNCLGTSRIGAAAGGAVEAPEDNIRETMAASSPDGPVLNQKHTFIRSYQACVPCRKRKVKCDLGDPGNPSDPPCLRCRREHKDCYFQDLRTNKNSPSAKGDASPPAKRARIEGVAESSPTSLNSATGKMDSFGDIFAVTKSSVTRRATVLSPNESATADRILHKEVHNAKEALNLLYEAAAESRSESDDAHGAHAESDARASKDDVNTVAWRDFWCVKAGWMTEGEARHYIDLYLLFCMRRLTP
jgi:Fungal Zn(2)-Cys(6) binuclear cluster domain